MAAVAVVAAVVAVMFVVAPASARSAPDAAAPRAASGNPYQRGPDPTVASIEATRGPFATAQLNVAPGNGFNGGVVSYPTDTSLGTWGALAIVPGYSALCADEEAWMGPWLSSFGFVVICVETNTRTDSADARAAELLAALNWLTTQSPVKGQIDPGRLSVLGHSAGGAGAILAAERQPSLKAMIGLAPGFPGNGLSMATDTVPTLVIGGQNDTVVTPSYLSGLYATLPGTTQSGFAQIAGADHVYYTRPNNVEMKLLIPWLKLFVDSDTRYSPFLCPALPDPSAVSIYQPKCPYTPPGGSTPPPSTSSGPPMSPAGGRPVHAVGAGKCLDVPGLSATAGTQTDIRTCDGGAGQLWTRASAGRLTVQTGGSTMCLDAAGRGASPGTKVQIWPCNGGSNQQWNVNANGTITGTQSGLCLDVTGGSTADGALVELWTCNGGSNQQWTSQ
ncbi:RICIN domain-containing protein [Actinacidiphila paucisporea]|uniref:RICIN domain-containing protein n=1 Tax=Actinacidiphila paucisporea TaxID=310782 RepID=UPI001F4093CC|nr:RICIN domain-containing protein [Actinacidiphila paucisporea]